MSGSSPLSRGIPRCDERTWQRTRIIPALAGNTLQGVQCGADTGDHPRSRGEYWNAVDLLPMTNGSSPLSRGIPPGGGARHQWRGIIPALAGNTVGSPRSHSPVRDHPRSRGEYPDDLSFEALADGSSPLSRGIPRFSVPKRLQRGIIPALAGNTAAAGLYDVTRPDHPRSRGEYVLPIPRPPTMKGSSPLSRGILCRGIHGHNPSRIIPALAGNTHSIHRDQQS